MEVIQRIPLQECSSQECSPQECLTQECPAQMDNICEDMTAEQLNAFLEELKIEPTPPPQTAAQSYLAKYMERTRKFEQTACPRMPPEPTGAPKCVLNDKSYQELNNPNYWSDGAFHNQRPASLPPRHPRVSYYDEADDESGGEPDDTLDTIYETVKEIDNSMIDLSDNLTNTGNNVEEINDNVKDLIKNMKELQAHMMILNEKVANIWEVIQQKL